jgi:hypothetical protein
MPIPLLSKSKTAKRRHRGNDLAQQSDPFSMNRWAGIDADSRDIAARVGQTFGDPLSDEVAGYRYDRNTRRQLFEEDRDANDEDDIRVALNDFRRPGFGAGGGFFSAVSFDLEVLSLDLPQPPKLGKQGSGKFTSTGPVQVRAWL